MNTLTHYIRLTHTQLESASIVDNSLDFVDEFIFDVELLVIDVDSCLAARDKERVERQLEEIVSTLAGCHSMTFLPLTSYQRDRYTWCLFWVNMFLAEIRNMWAFALERKSQLSVRNKKLVLMDRGLCRSFGKYCLNNLRE